jgi:hypothetical protein
MQESLASLVNLNHPGHYLHWGFIEISLGNMLVIAAMLVVFVFAVLLPFPHGRAVTAPPASPAGTRTVDEGPEGRAER